MIDAKITAAALMYVELYLSHTLILELLLKRSMCVSKARPAKKRRSLVVAVVRAFELQMIKLEICAAFEC